MSLSTTMHHLPLAYRCAIELLESSGERTEARFLGLIDHFERANGLQHDHEGCTINRKEALRVARARGCKE